MARSICTITTIIILTTTWWISVRTKKNLFCCYENIITSYGNGFIRDDHRVNGSSRQSRNASKPLTPTRNGKQTKSPRNTKGQQKRRTSRPHKQRNQNSKTEGIFI